MNKTIRRLSVAAVVGGLSVALAGAGYAQDQGGPPPPPPGAQMGPGHGWDPAAMRARMEERRAAHERMLHDAIGIRPDQEAAWQAFIGSMKPPEGERHGPKGREQGPPPQPLTTPERLDRMAQRMAERQQRFQQHAAAVKAFYAALDPRQQKTFDALVGGRGMGGGHRFGGGGMMGR